MYKDDFRPYAHQRAWVLNRIWKYRVQRIRGVGNFPLRPAGGYDDYYGWNGYPDINGLCMGKLAPCGGYYGWAPLTPGNKY